MIIWRIMESLISAIKQATLEPRNDKMLHFSSHLNHNRHTVLYTYYGYPVEYDQPWANTLPLLQGNAIHEQLHRIMEDNHKPYVSERMIVPDEGFTYSWCGTADAYTEDEYGNVWLVDYKTISGAGMSFLDAPKPEHVMQVSAYYHFDMIHVDRIGILYLPTTPDYKRRWHEPVFYEVKPMPKDELIKVILGVEADINVYNSSRMLPPIPDGSYKWKTNKRNKYHELWYSPHYSTMYCPWRFMSEEDDPCGCSRERRVCVGKVGFDGEVVEGDEDTLMAYVNLIGDDDAA